MLSDSGINLLGIDREIIPKNSMAIINQVADGGQWNLINPETSKYISLLQEKFDFKKESN